MAKRFSVHPNRSDRTIKQQEISVTQVNPALHEVSANLPDKSFDRSKNDIKVLARWFRSPCIVGCALRLLAYYTQTSTAPPRPPDFNLLLLISVAWARAQRKARP